MKKYSVEEKETGMLLDEFDTLEEVKEYMESNVIWDIENSWSVPYFCGDWEDNYQLYDNELDECIDFSDEIVHTIREIEKKYNIQLKERYGIREIKEGTVFQSFETLKDVKNFMKDKKLDCYELYDNKYNEYIDFSEIDFKDKY